MSKHPQFLSKALPKLYPSLLVLALFGSLVVSKGCRCAKSQEPLVQVCFTPNGPCTQLVQEVIDQAKDTILVQAYFFTSPTIAKSLIAAHQRGVTVQILVDRSQTSMKGSKIRWLLKKGIPVWVDAILGIAHNKVMILDDDCVLTGSFNWTVAAQQSNAENLILIRDRYTNQAYKANWEQRIAQAQPVTLQDLTKTKKPTTQPEQEAE